VRDKNDRCTTVEIKPNRPIQMDGQSRIEQNGDDHPQNGPHWSDQSIPLIRRLQSGWQPRPPMIIPKNTSALEIITPSVRVVPIHDSAALPSVLNIRASVRFVQYIEVHILNNRLRFSHGLARGLCHQFAAPA
jgi:hypothetical protein